MESGDEPRPKAAKDGHVMPVGTGNRFQRGSGPHPAAFEVEATEPDGVRASLRVKTRSRGATPQSSGTRRMRVPSLKNVHIATLASAARRDASPSGIRLDIGVTVCNGRLDAATRPGVGPSPSALAALHSSHGQPLERRRRARRDRRWRAIRTRSGTHTASNAAAAPARKAETKRSWPASRRTARGARVRRSGPSRQASPSR